MVDPQSSPWGAMLSHGHPCRLDDLRIPKFDTQPYGVSENRVAPHSNGLSSFSPLSPFSPFNMAICGYPLFSDKARYRNHMKSRSKVETKTIHGLVFRSSFGLLSPLISGDLMVRIPPRVIPMGKVMGKTMTFCSFLVPIFSQPTSF